MKHRDIAELPDQGCGECLRVFLPQIYELRLEELRTGRPHAAHGSFAQRRLNWEVRNNVKYEKVKPVDERSGPIGTRKPFAGIFRCQSCGYEGSYYFYDSEPKVTRCAGCFEYDTAALVRTLESAL